MVATIMVSLSWLTLPLPPDWPESLEQPAPRPTIMLPSSKPPSSLFMVFFIENVLRFLWGKLPPRFLVYYSHTPLNGQLSSAIYQYFSSFSFVIFYNFANL